MLTLLLTLGMRSLAAQQQEDVPPPASLRQGQGGGEQETQQPHEPTALRGGNSTATPALPPLEQGAATPQQEAPQLTEVALLPAERDDVAHQQLQPQSGPLPPAQRRNRRTSNARKAYKGPPLRLVVVEEAEEVEDVRGVDREKEWMRKQLSRLQEEQQILRQMVAEKTHTISGMQRDLGAAQDKIEALRQEVLQQKKATAYEQQRRGGTLATMSANVQRWKGEYRQKKNDLLAKEEGYQANIAQLTKARGLLISKMDRDQQKYAMLQAQLLDAEAEYGTLQDNLQVIKDNRQNIDQRAGVLYGKLRCAQATNMGLFTAHNELIQTHEQEKCKWHEQLVAVAKGREAYRKELIQSQEEHQELEQRMEVLERTNTQQQEQNVSLTQALTTATSKSQVLQQDLDQSKAGHSLQLGTSTSVVSCLAALATYFLPKLHAKRNAKRKKLPPQEQASCPPLSVC